MAIQTNLKLQSFKLEAHQIEEVRQKLHDDWVQRFEELQKEIEHVTPTDVKEEKPSTTETVTDSSNVSPTEGEGELSVEEVIERLDYIPKLMSARSIEEANNAVDKANELLFKMCLDEALYNKVVITLNSVTNERMNEIEKGKVSPRKEETLTKEMVKAKLDWEEKFLRCVNYRQVLETNDRMGKQLEKYENMLPKEDYIELSKELYSCFNVYEAPFQEASMKHHQREEKKESAPSVNSIFSNPIEDFPF